jgi:hypothetical protein
MRKIAQEATTKKVTIALGILLVFAASPNKGHATCEQECLSFCSASSGASSRQFVCQSQCLARCYSHRAEHKSENR